MKQMRSVGLLILTCLLMTGCQSESEQLKDLVDQTADLATRSVESQNDVNVAVAKANENIADLHLEVQQERSGLQRQREFLDHQLESLDQDRRDLHSERRSELAWSESFQFLALIVAAAMPLFLCAFLVWAASRKSVEQEEVNTILLRELTSAEPRLIASPNLPAIEDRSNSHDPGDSKPTNDNKPKEKN